MSYEKRKVDAFHTELIDTKTERSTIVHTSDLDPDNPYWKKKKCKCVREGDDD